MKNAWKILIILVLILAAVFITFNTKGKNEISEVCIQEYCFNVELAETLEERQQGLMYRESLNQNSGMLFIFPKEDNYAFWMKNTLIPLDIIWINQDLEIVHVETAEPCKEDPCQIYDPNTNALYVLEINPGIINKTKIEKEKVRIK